MDMAANTIADWHTMSIVLKHSHALWYAFKGQ